MNTPVTKKNIVRRIAYVSKYFILVIFIFGFGWDLLHVRNVSYEKRIEIYLGSAATLAGILFVWVYIWVQKKKVIKLIQRQEECLNVDFDADMKGITMCGGKVGTKESRERIFAQLDEIEAYQKQIQAPGLEDNLKEIYHNMHLNGILPPEREEHFPDAIHQGEIHRFYN